MSTVTPFHPALEVKYVFEQEITPETQNLGAFAMGPLAEVARYDIASLQAAGKLGQYDSIGTLLEGEYKTSYVWPNRPSGGVIDTDYTKLYIERALLKYFEETADAFIIESAAALNRIIHPTLSFQDNPADPVTYPKSVSLGDRGVLVGDRLKIEGVLDDDSPFSMATYVQAIDGVKSAAVINAAVPAAGNQGVTGEDATATPDGGNTTDLTGVAGGTYSGFEVGLMSETYVVEFIQAPTVLNDLTTSRVKVTSASGLDDQVSVQPAASGVPFAIGTRGATLALTTGIGPVDPVVGDKFSVYVEQDYTPVTVDVTGTFTADDNTDRTYLVEIITGGSVASGAPVARVSEILGQDITSTVMIDVSGAQSQVFDAGQYGVKLQFTPSEGYVVGDRWTVLAEASKPQEQDVLVLAHNLPSNAKAFGAGTAGDLALRVTFCLEANAEIPRETGIGNNIYFDDRDQEILVYAGVQLTIPSWTVSGTATPLPVFTDAIFGTSVNMLYTDNRHWYPLGSSIITADSSVNLTDSLQGPVHPDNPLKYAALKMQASAAGRPIYLFNTGDPSSMTGWSKALSLASDRTDVYGLVPLSRRTEVIDAVAAHVASMNNPEFNRYRVAWFTSEIPFEAAVVTSALSDDSQVVLAIIEDDPNLTGTQYRQVTITSGNAGFVASGVRSGDFLRYAFNTDALGVTTYDSYEIDRVVNESTLILKSGPATEQAIPLRTEVHRNLSTQDKVDVIQQNIEPFTFDAAQLDNLTAGQYTGYLFRYLPFGYVQDGGSNVASYFMAATIAAMRSAIQPHSPMTRMPVSGFSGVNELEEFDIAQLDIIAASGGFLVTRNQLTGDPTIRHAVTSATINDVNQREESIISNLHSMSRLIVTTLDPIVGRGNVTDALLAGLRSELDALGNFLISANFTPTLGGQLLSQEILDLRPSPIFDDGIIVRLRWDLPAPANRIDTTIFVT